ncbi:TFG-like protein [Mya arenaria]|uniref:TFG-like protein n=1 Tax=Mya arenaria TaxID=6604 RepID=A0ABY7EGL7_MYAAR|nr:TFG-like protein [Mya arenaria]
MSEPGIDLTGKLIIKVALGDDIRRILITNEDITYDELVLMMQRVYRGKLNSSDDIVIKYKDEDNDLITIFDSSDLSFAIQCSRILKITLYVNGKPEPLQSNELKLIKGELRLIRDRCTQLLDKLDSRPQMDLPSSTVEAGPAVKPPKNRVTDSPRRTTPQPSFVPVTSGSKEFDPLSSQRSGDEQSKVMSSFGIGGGEARGAYQQGGSGQKLPPWQQQQPVTPSAYSQGQQQVGCPVVMSDQKYYSYPLRGLTSTAGRDSPQTYKSMQHYHHSLMQAHMYTGHEDRASPSPLSPAQQPTPKSYSGSPAPAGQPQQAGYPGQQASSGQPQAPPQSQQQPQGGGGAFTPIAPPAGSQPQAHPGYPQGAGLATVQASGQGPVSSPFSGQLQVVSQLLVPSPNSSVVVTRPDPCRLPRPHLVQRVPSQVTLMPAKGLGTGEDTPDPRETTPRATSNICTHYYGYMLPPAPKQRRYNDDVQHLHPNFNT